MSATASNTYILYFTVLKLALSTQNRRYINSLYSPYKDKTLTVGGTFKNAATLLVPTAFMICHLEEYTVFQN